jgi:hypothetical protein
MITAAGFPFIHWDQLLFLLYAKEKKKPHLLPLIGGH